MIAGTGGSHGMRVFFPDGAGKWKFSCVKSNGREHNYGGSGKGCYVRGAERHAACVGSRRQGLSCSRTRACVRTRVWAGVSSTVMIRQRPSTGRRPNRTGTVPSRAIAPSRAWAGAGRGRYVYAATQKIGSVAGHVTAISRA